MVLLLRNSCHQHQAACVFPAQYTSGSQQSAVIDDRYQLGADSRHAGTVEASHITANVIMCTPQTFKYSILDAVPPIHGESYHVATDKDPSMPPSCREVPVYF